MDVKNTPLKGLQVVELDVFGDSRGFFVERFNAEKFSEFDLPTDFPQINHSRSAPGVIRGLHFQPTPAQGKMVGCANGRIWDVAVDIRPESPTYGQNFALELSDMNGKLLWIPPGFAHGFAVLGDQPADVVYFVTSIYNPKGEQGIAWNDPSFDVPWPLTDMQLTDGKPVTSQRDDTQQSFVEFKKNPAKW